MKLLFQGSQFPISALITLSKQSTRTTVAVNLWTFLPPIFSQILWELKLCGILNLRRGKYAGPLPGVVPETPRLVKITLGFYKQGTQQISFPILAKMKMVKPSGLDSPFHKLFQRIKHLFIIFCHSQLGYLGLLKSSLLLLNCARPHQ